MFPKALLVAALLAVAGCQSKKNPTAPKATPTPLVDVRVATRDSLPSVVEANGSVLANELVELHPEVSGRLTYLHLPEGARGARGTVLAKVNDADLQAQLQQQQAQADLAAKTQQRAQDLLKREGISQAEYDIAATQVKNLGGAIQLLRAQIDKTVVRAPFDGELGLRLVSPGAYVTPATLLATLQQTTRLKIDFTLPEVYARLVSKGRTVAVQANDSEQSLAATVVAIEPQISVQTRNLRVRALLDAGARLNPGTFVKVLLNENRFGIAVPSNAVIPDAQSDKVIVVRQGKGTFVSVETGIRFGDQVEIAKGLTVGDSVVVSGVLFVRPNTPLKIKPARKSNPVG